MRNSAPLCILIPAWKPHFLAQTLESVARAFVPDLCQVWIFDDAGPEEIKSICAPFLERFPDWHYHRFERNLGQQDLVAHWNRCVGQTSGDWIWLFSDDDRMQEDSVTAFFQTQARFPETQVFRFRQTMIDEKGNTLASDFPIPDPVSGEELGELRFRRKLYSSAVAYVFSRQAFLRHKGFVAFPLAWCSDDASWIAFAGQAGIRTIPEGGVFWRISSYSISGNKDALRLRKMEAAVAFTHWYNQQFPRLRNDLSFRAEQVIWIRLQLSHLNFFPGFFQTLSWIRKLELPSLGMKIRAFGDLFGLSYVYAHEVLLGNKKARGFRAWLYRILPKF